jgi:AcrR family transcriptional regulator
MTSVSTTIPLVPQILAKMGRRLAADVRREHLLDVAAQILLEDGYEAVTMEAVKERAGVSRGLTYVHFANAEDLAFALYEREANELDRRIGEVRNAAGSFEDRVRAAVKVYFDFAAERGGLMAILQVKLGGRWSQRSVQKALSRRFELWSGALERELGLPEGAAQALARASIAAVEAFASGWRMKKLKRAEAEAMAVAFSLGGLRDAIAARTRGPSSGR